MKLTPRTLLAALAYTGAQRLTSLARKLSPGLPERIYVTGDLWCHLPDRKRLVLAKCSIPEEVREFHRHALFSLAVVEEPDGELSALFLLNANESPYVMWGRDEDGYEINEDDIPDAPEADMDALIRAASSLPKNDPSSLLN